jgi:hypothetical protein
VPTNADAEFFKENPIHLSRASFYILYIPPFDASAYHALLL